MFSLVGARHGRLLSRTVRFRSVSHVEDVSNHDEKKVKKQVEIRHLKF